MKRECYVASDFDGVCVVNRYPEIGPDIGADAWLRAVIAMGASLILYTDRDGAELDDALRWFKGHGIAIWATNNNPDQDGWTSSRKVFRHVAIDPTCIGTPLKQHKSGKACVDWDILGPALLRRIAAVLGPRR